MKLENIDPRFRKQVFRMLAFLIGVMVLNRLSAGGGMVFLILASIYYAATRKIGMFLAMYMFIPFLTEMNGQLIGTGVLFQYGSRIAVFSSTALLLMQFSNTRGRYSLPIGGMCLYMLCAFISSINGYCPIVSYLKIVNFTVFMIGLYFGGRIISEDLAELNVVRAAILAAAIFLVFGSIMMFFVPSMGYMNSSAFASLGYSESQIAAAMSESGGVRLFRGVTNHSQTLAVKLVVFTGWVICDMFFVEQRITKLHLCIVAAALPLLQKTSSRTALVGFVALCFILMCFSVPMSRMSPVARLRIKRLMSTGVAVLVVLACVMEIRGGGMTRWLRKNSGSGDTRGLVEAVTSTRMGLVEQSLAEFRGSPMLGVGFQVNEDSAEHARRQRFVVSAPVERGVLPIAILAETGVLGAVAFAIFLLMFYAGCLRQRLVSTMSLFTVFLVLNMSECTFFSPNGGGTPWAVLMVGGFVIDIYAKACDKWICR